MRSGGPREAEFDDLTARARIRDAAVRRFGADGFGASVRAVAADAGVSPGLVIHHFRSKDGLRAACDEHVLRVIREAKSHALVKAGPGNLVAQLASLDEYAPLVAYLVQAMLAGGDLAATLLDQAVADAEQYLQEGVDAGRLRPSRDPAARARYLAYVGVGVLLVYMRLHPPADGDIRPMLHAYMQATALPALEICTEGLLTDRSMLEEYLSYAPPPPSAQA